MSTTREIARNKVILLIVTSLASFSAALLSIAVSVALPSIGAEFKMEAHLLSWVQTSFVLASAVAMIPVGRIADIYGRKKIFSFGLCLFIVSSILCAASQSSVFLICMMVIQGIGAAAIWGPAVAILTSSFSAGERGRAIGFNTAAIYCGLSLGPFWGGLLTQHFGWRSVFYITSVIVIVAAIIVFLNLKGEWSESQEEKLDIKGAVTLCASLALILFGFSSIPSIFSFPCIILGLFGMVLFYRFETRTAQPVIKVSLFNKNPVFVLILLGVLLLYTATFSPNFLFSLYLQYNRGYSPQMAGAILLTPFVIMAIVAPISGRISDKIDPLKLSAFGMGITCVSLFLTSLLNGASSLWFILLVLGVFGFGCGLFSSPTTNAVMSSVDKKYFGVASGIFAAMRHTGQVLSMGIVMILIAVYIGNVEITPQYYPAFLQSFKVACIILAALCLVGMLVMLAGGRLRKRESEAEKNI